MDTEAVIYLPDSGADDRRAFWEETRKANAEAQRKVQGQLSIVELLNYFVH